MPALSVEHQDIPTLAMRRCRWTALAPRYPSLALSSLVHPQPSSAFTIPSSTTSHYPPKISSRTLQTSTLTLPHYPVWITSTRAHPHLQKPCIVASVPIRGRKSRYREKYDDDAPRTALQTTTIEPSPFPRSEIYCYWNGGATWTITSKKSRP